MERWVAAPWYVSELIKVTTGGLRSISETLSYIAECIPMNEVHPKFVSWPEQASILLVAAPVALFMGTWFHPLLGMPAAAIVAWLAWRCLGCLAPAPLPSLASLVFLALLAVSWTWIAGYGGQFDQTWDHNFRNALLRDLVDRRWPVLWNTPAGTVVLDYYLGWSMIPALVGKVLGWRAATMAMAGVCAFGAFLVLLLFVRAVGAWRWWIPLVFILWSGLDLLGWILMRRIPGVHSCIEGWSNPIYYVSNLLNFFNAAHLMIPTWIITLLLIGRRLDRRVLVGFSSLLVPLAPFPALGVAPFLLWELLKGEGAKLPRVRGILTAENILPPLVLASACGPYFLSNQGAGLLSGWFFEFSPPPTASTLAKYAAFWLLEILIPAAAIWCAGQRDGLFKLAVIVLCLIPLRRAGLTNDLALKASVPGLAILTFYTARALLAKPKGMAKWLLVGAMSIGVATPLHHVITSSWFTITSPSTREKDCIGSFDPARVSTGGISAYLANFRSAPLEEQPLLRTILRR